MSISLYRKYRPQNFAGVAGQRAAIEIITNSIARDRVGHAYLFSGSRGCGKTSVARIFAKALNCLDRQGFEPCGQCSNCTAITAGESLDVIEIDGASNNGVDSIRELKENVALAPFTSKYKIYIIDEVHMLSQGAFNALLKTLEEPPEHVIFILATTEPQRVPVTIRSRCQHIPFHTISPEDIFKRVEEVCRLEDVKAEPEALWEIARQADGALRDALSLLEQIMASGEITLSNVEASFGAGSRPVFERWIKTLRTDPGEAYTSLKSMFDSGASGVRVFEEMFAIVRDLWLSSKWPKLAGTLGNSEQEKNFLTDEAKNWKPEKLHYLLHTVNKILTQARLGIKSDIILGMFFMSLEPAPRQEESYSPPPALPHPPTRGPEVQKVEAAKSEMKANAVEFDETFKENLLSKAHDEDFTSYCGLYDARPYERDGNLILDMEHIYCYEVLRMSKNSATLSKIFEDYKAVILKFGTAECTCASYEVAQPQPQKTAPEVDEQIAPRDDEEEAQDTRNTPSAFDKFKRELTQLQTKPEIIFIKHSEQDESIDETDYEEEGDDD